MLDSFQGDLTVLKTGMKIAVVGAVIGGCIGFYIEHASANDTHNFNAHIYQMHGQPIVKTSSIDNTVSAHNKVVIAKAVKALMEKCPEFSKFAGSIQPGSINILARINAPEGYNVYTDRRGWRDYIDVTLRLRKDDIAPWQREYYALPGQQLEYYIGGGKHPGIVAMTPFEVQYQAGTTICGRVLDKKPGAFRRPFISDASMSIVDNLH